MPLQEERGSRVGADPRVEEGQGRVLAEDQEAVVDHPVRMTVRLLRPLAIHELPIARALVRLARAVMPGSEDGHDPQGDEERQQERDVAILAHRAQLSPRDEHRVAEIRAFQAHEFAPSSVR